MEKFKQYRLLKKVQKLLDAPARPEEDYDDAGTSATMFIGAAAPRAAGHFANGAVALRQTQVKDLAGRTVALVDALLAVEEPGAEPVAPGAAVEALFVELAVRFQELDLGLLFTEQEKGERSRGVAGRRTEERRAVSEGGGGGGGGGGGRRAAQQTSAARTAALEAEKARIAAWMKELLERKRRLYKIETTVRDLGVNVNDVRCRGLEKDRRVALARLDETTDRGVSMLKEVTATLEAFVAAGRP